MRVRDLVKIVIGVVIIVAAIYLLTPYYLSLTTPDTAPLDQDRDRQIDEWSSKPAVLLTVTPRAIDPGQSVRVVWSSSAADSCIGGASDTSVIPDTWNNPQLKGSMTIEPMRSMTLTLICQGPGGLTIEKADISTDGARADTISATSPSSAGTYTSYTEPMLGTLYPPLRATCATQQIGTSYTDQIISRAVVAYGGTGIYSYRWSGTDGLSGYNEWISSIYPQTGIKSASVTIFSGGWAVTAPCPDIEVIQRPVSRTRSSGSSGESSDDGSSNENTDDTGDTDDSGDDDDNSYVPPQPSLTLTADPTTIYAGQSVVVSWHAYQLPQCSSSGDNLDAPPEWRTPGTSGSFIYIPSSDTTLSLSCSRLDPPITIRKSAHITVLDPEPEPITLENIDGSVQGSSFEISWTNSAEIKVAAIYELSLEQSELGPTGWSPWHEANMEGCDLESCSVFTGIESGTTYRFRGRLYDTSIGSYLPYSDETEPLAF